MTETLSPRILLSIDDLRLRRTLETGLRANGFTVSTPGDAEATIILAESFVPDVVIIDSAMSSGSKPLHATIRSSADCYLIGLELAGSERARIEMLRSGTDDAISVPVSNDELAARCEAMMRRPRIVREDWDPTPLTVIELGPLVIDTGRHELRLNGVEVPATRIEFSLLEHLGRHPTEVASRQELLESVWGPHWVGDTHVVDVHLSNLRRKLDEALPNLPVIHTVRGVGFRISNEVLDLAEAAMKPSAVSAQYRPDTALDGNEMRLASG